jgi:hypothetical protein
MAASATARSWEPQTTNIRYGPVNITGKVEHCLLEVFAHVCNSMCIILPAISFWGKGWWWWWWWIATS